MPYVAGDVRITIEGVAGSHELWVNTWSVKGATDPGDAQTAVTALHAFYDALSADRLGNDWSALTAESRNMTDGISTARDWEPTPGQLVDDPLPSQLAIRVSLDSLLGHRGGPFLTGFTVAAVDATGQLDTAWQTDILGHVDDIHTSLVAAGMTLAIDRPSIPESVNAGRVRIGRRFDVIRRRGNDTPEVYASTDL